MISAPALPRPVTLSSSLTAILIGALYALVMLFLAATAEVLVTGGETRPPFALSMIAGAASAILHAGWLSRVPRATLLTGLVFALLLSSLSLVKGSAPQVAVLIVTSLGFGHALSRIYRGIRPGACSRVTLEMLFLRALKGLGLILFTGFIVLPFYVMVMTSLKNQQALIANPLDFSLSFDGGLTVLFSSYIELFTRFDFGRYLAVSALVSLATVFITLLFSVPGAYAVARLRFRGKSTLSRSIIFIYMVPAIVLVIPLYAVFSQLGLRNSLIGLLIVYPASTIPVALYMLQGYFAGLPAELEEAGLMDGLSRAGVIWTITMPLALPALASVSLYVFMIAWNEFLFAFMFLDDPAIYTLSRGLVALNSSEVPRQHLMAGAVIATVPVLGIFLWLERFMVAGLTAGSVKG